MRRRGRRRPQVCERVGAPTRLTEAEGDFTVYCSTRVPVPHPVLLTRGRTVARSGPSRRLALPPLDALPLARYPRRLRPGSRASKLCVCRRPAHSGRRPGTDGRSRSERRAGDKDVSPTADAASPSPPRLNDPLTESRGLGRRPAIMAGTPACFRPHRLETRHDDPTRCRL
jgi:hypothetical protein